MTATDELRRLLDERGVEWQDEGYPTTNTTWAADGVVWRGLFRDGCIELVAQLTPEQAIEATLGRGTCEVVSSIRHDYEGGYGGTEYEHELSCGHKTWWADDDPPEWCPHCGRKVVDA